jgi:hypothetical protein
MDWKQRHREALKGARYLCGLESGPQVMVKSIGVISAITFVWLYGDLGGAVSEILLRIGATIALILIFPLVYAWKLFQIGELILKRPAMYLIILGSVIAAVGILVGAVMIGIGVSKLQNNGSTQQAITNQKLSEFEWGFEKHVGYPYIGMMGGAKFDPPVIFQFQAQGHNKTGNPISKAKAYVRSDRTGTIYPGFFNIRGQFYSGEQIDPIPVDAIIDIHAYFRSDKKPISMRDFLDTISPLTFFFEYDGKEYRRSFKQSEIEALLRKEEQDMRPKPAAPQMTPRKQTAVEQKQKVALVDAARRAYTETRGTLAAGIAEAQGKTKDGILQWYCFMLVGTIGIKLWGLREPANTDELIDWKKRGLHFEVKDEKVKAVEKQNDYEYINLMVDPDELPAAIVRIREMGRESQQH